MGLKRVDGIDDYCNYCGVDEIQNAVLTQTREGKTICDVCADTYGLCEICGSTRLEEQTSDEQLHYQELCFK